MKAETYRELFEQHIYFLEETSLVQWPKSSTGRLLGRAENKHEI